ncbi:uncharacterized protein LOC125238724 [Leguminivora glycinivorella]|uniref:uncharacterized protein LOC125238724 n=1 Tax=Leguminivora glycinivorella TaxID=1035111 RepID=UPI00201069CD|nr:uncharacterized protein LOC125238724 [Leguminivora glycinivorella]
MAQLSPEMSLLLERMTEKLNIQTQTITDNVTATILLKVEETIKPIVEENKKLRIELQELNRKIETLDNNARRNNVILHGIPESQEEKFDQLINTVINTIHDLDVDLKITDINRVQRLGRRQENDNKIRPILLSTTSTQKKIEILRNKKKMKQNTYITHDVSKKSLQERKEKTKTTVNETEKRKRPDSESPSPNKPVTSTRKDNKITKVDAFQVMRERAYSLSDKNTWRN